MAAKLTLQSVLPLPNSQVTIPHIGFGVYQSHGPTCVKSCQAALTAGYRQIDSAQYYGNESLVHEAITSQSTVPRSALFLTTKMLSGGPTLDSASSSISASVAKLDGPGPSAHADLFLIHSPSSGAASRQRMWKALERAHSAGTCRAIGVSNYGVGHLEEQRAYARVWPPHVNQLELHPWCQQREVVKYCRAHGIVLQAYCPLVRNARAGDATLVRLAKKHGKSEGQVLIRWSLQQGFVPLPKSDTPERIQANADVFDFVLDKEDMAELDAKDEGSRGAIVEAASNTV
ncbi:hypothetical protein FH972_021070 [Carpinus fangiana]|uniref:NADP-dependent oxidoreductase domain-containing protein n=1 Tax=Carpinus fangiana TaxID=176857 RepID=A0A5N6KNB9_9ROSI|nr:hypothetical protein FH972_021070 [Carpinus fangiana]